MAARSPRHGVNCHSTGDLQEKPALMKGSTTMSTFKEHPHLSQPSPHHPAAPWIRTALKGSDNESIANRRPRDLIWTSKM